MGPKVINGKCFVTENVGSSVGYNKLRNPFPKKISNFENITKGLMPLTHRTNINKANFKFFNKDNPFPFFIKKQDEQLKDESTIGNPYTIYWSTKEMRFFYGSFNTTNNDKYVEVKNYKDYKKLFNI